MSLSTVALAQLAQGELRGPTVEWSGDSRRIQYREIDRGYQGVRVNEIDAATGGTHVGSLFAGAWSEIEAGWGK